MSCFICSEPAQQTSVQLKYDKLYSTMFSPTEPNLITAAGTGGTRLFDLRKDAPIRYVEN